jgi:hypothetical protein
MFVLNFGGMESGGHCAPKWQRLLEGRVASA